MEDDAQLLRRYLKNRSEVAFTELVQRHVNLVYHTALRRVGGDRHLAEDVTQGVFADLARKAASLQDRVVLAGWLHTSTRFAAAQAVRTAQRQKTHALEAHLMQQINTAPAANWEQLRPVIDEALDELNEAEREVLLLRFFEDRPLAEVGARFALSPDAARMRVDRALAKLHGLLAKRGITSTAAALVAVFAGQSGLAAPGELAARIVANVLHSSGTAVAGSIALWKLLTGVTVVLLGTGIVLYQARTPVPESPVAAVTARSVAPAVTLEAPVQAAGHLAVEAVAPGPEAASAAGDFVGLPFRQKNLLKRLWAIQQVVPDQGARHSGFKVSPQSPRFADVEAAVAMLQASGLVNVGDKGVIFLTKKGKVFCEAHRQEMDAYAVTSQPD